MNPEPCFHGKLAIQQRVLTPYRAAFFDLLAQACEGGLGVCAGLHHPKESITTTNNLKFAQFTSVQNIHLFRGPFTLCYQRGLPGWLFNWNPDVLILEANPRDLANPAAIRWMKIRGRPVLGWGLGALPLGQHVLLRNLWVQRAQAFLRQFDGLLTYSRLGADQYAALGFPTDRIFVAPNAVSRRPTQPMPSRSGKFPHNPSVLFVGRLQKRKRVDLLLRACASLPEPMKPTLTIVGDGPERLALESLAKTVYPSAKFHGAVRGAELQRCFSSADLFVLPGTGGLAVQEAMSSGLPIIMGRGDGTNDDLVRPENGWQVPPDSLETLTNTLHTALADLSRLRKMGGESYRIVREEINLENMVAVFVEAINRFVPSKTK